MAEHCAISRQQTNNTLGLNFVHSASDPLPCWPSIGPIGYPSQKPTSTQISQGSEHTNPMDLPEKFSTCNWLQMSSGKMSPSIHNHI